MINRAPPATPTSRRSASDQERRIAELASQDLTNRQIAQELYLTEKTVETHLSNAYRKLGIKSRRQLAAKLTGSGAASARRA